MITVSGVHIRESINLSNQTGSEKGADSEKRRASPSWGNMEFGAFMMAGKPMFSVFGSV
jgi:hypothetical protein